MRKIIASCAAVLMLTSGVVAQQPIGKGEPSSVTMAQHITDADTFVQMAGVSNYFEVVSSEVALQRSETDEVRTFAQKMIDDHNVANERLTAAVAESGLSIVLPNNVDASAAEDVDRLNSLTENFDGIYLDMQIIAHDTAVALFTSYSQNGDNEVLKRFATEMLPTLQMHRQMIPAGATRQ